METATPTAPEAASASNDKVEVLAANGRRTWRVAADVREHDFRRPTFLAPTELRKLRQRSEEFVAALAARLSMYLRLEVGLKLTKLQTLCYQNFTESLCSPAHVVMFKAEPLKGIALLDVPPKLGLTMVDRLLGGPGQCPEEHRELTEIENALLSQAVQVILNEFSEHWQTVEHLRCTQLGYETNGKFLQTAPRDAVMVGLAVEVHVGNCAEQLQFAFPHYTIEPLVKQLTALSVNDQKMTAASAPASAPWNPELNEVPVTVAAEWTGLELTVRELLALKPGDVISLEPNITETVRVNISSAPKFTARFGTSGANWAVELSEPISQ